MSSKERFDNTDELEPPKSESAPRSSHCYDAMNVWVYGPKPIRQAIQEISEEWIDAGESCQQTTVDLLNACRTLIADYDRMKAEVIRTRIYAMRKGIGIGESVAWAKIKEHYGAGRSDQEDVDWLKEYEARSLS